METAVSAFLCALCGLLLFLACGVTCGNKSCYDQGFYWYQKKMAGRYVASLARKFECARERPQSDDIQTYKADL
jgi:hypothetical protein